MRDSFVGESSVCHGPTVMTAVALAVLLGADAGSPPALLPSAFSKSVFEAHAVLEVEVPLDPQQLRSAIRWDDGLRKARPIGLITSRVLMDAPEKVTLRWEVMRSCLALTNGKSSVRVLLVISGNPPAPMIFPLATMGFAMESTPGYAKLKEALVEAFTWQGGVASLWKAQKDALVSDNPYLRHLAVEWLVQHEASAVIDETWGAPGTEARVKAEAASRIVPECKL